MMKYIAVKDLKHNCGFFALCVFAYRFRRRNLFLCDVHKQYCRSMMQMLVLQKKCNLLNVYLSKHVPVVIS